MVQDEWMDSRSLIRFEEKEYMNQVITTTTVKNTNTNEELFKLFDNVIYDVYHLNQPTPTNVASSTLQLTNSNSRPSKSIVTDIDKILVPIHFEKRLN